MPKVRRRIAFLAAATLIATLCVGQAGEKKVTSSYVWTLKASYPETGIDKVDEQIRLDLEEHLSEIIGDARVLVCLSEYEGAFEVGVDYETSRTPGNVLSIAYNIYTYPRGAAHPMSHMYIKNIDLATGEDIPFKDLFVDTQKALDIISENARIIVKADLHKQHPDLFPEDGPGIDEKWFTEGSEPTPENYAALRLEEGGVRVYFQQYQIVAYAFGMREAFIPLEKLAPAGPSKKVWPGAK